MPNTFRRSSFCLLPDMTHSSSMVSSMRSQRLFLAQSLMHSMRPSDRSAHVHTYGFMGIKAKAESCITIRVPSTATPRLVLSSEHDCMQGHVGLLSLKAGNGRERRPAARLRCCRRRRASRSPVTTYDLFDLPSRRPSCSFLSL